MDSGRKWAALYADDDRDRSAWMRAALSKVAATTYPRNWSFVGRTDQLGRKARCADADLSVLIFSRIPEDAVCAAVSLLARRMSVLVVSDGATAAWIDARIGVRAVGFLNRTDVTPSGVTAALRALFRARGSEGRLLRRLCESTAPIIPGFRSLKTAEDVMGSVQLSASREPCSSTPSRSELNRIALECSREYVELLDEDIAVVAHSDPIFLEADSVRARAAIAALIEEWRRRRGNRSRLQLLVWDAGHDARLAARSDPGDWTGAFDGAHLADWIDDGAVRIVSPPSFGRSSAPVLAFRKRTRPALPASFATDEPRRTRPDRPSIRLA